MTVVTDFEYPNVRRWYYWVFFFWGGGLSAVSPSFLSFFLHQLMRFQFDFKMQCFPVGYRSCVTTVKAMCV